MTWLEICGKNNDCSGCCPYSENGFGEYGQCRESLMADAYDLLKEQKEEIENLRQTAQSMMEGVCLLKEQEPKKPRRDTIGEYVCPHEGCHHRLSSMQKYCDVCGQAVKWK